MNKLMLASLTVLMAGATAGPAFAQDGGRSAAGESSWQGSAGNKGPSREEPREESGDGRHGGVADRGDHGDSGNDHRDQGGGHRDDNRDHGSYAGQQWQSQHRDYDRDRHDGHHDDHHDWTNDRHDWDSHNHRDSHYYTRYRDSRWSGYNWHPQYRYRASSHYIYPSGYHPYHWQVGYRMPYNYYNSSNYYVDYRMYRLPPPPYGYHWVRVDRDVVLVSLATGLIRDVLFGLFY